METFTERDRSSSLKKQVVDKLNKINYTIEEDALFFLGTISKIADARIYTLSRRSRYKRVNPKGRVDYERVKSAFNDFESELIKNAEQNNITAYILYKTMNGLCPLWPFC